ncbi:MAG TPA: fibronectin type III domain-containing protein [Pyrinomonadaceae bacterium]|nr:fibronectin type III domain-containing protein [Pyrinomonadaceae bacterium]
MPFALTSSACGKRRPPLPPVERIPQRTELLSGVQRGNRVILSWPAPRRNASAESVQSIRRVDVYRVAERPDAPLPLTEEQFSTRATLIGSVPYEEIKQQHDTLSYTDTLTLTEPVRLRYAIRYVNAAGQRAAFSNFLLLEPAARVSQPPALISVTNPTESSIVLRWQPPNANVDGSTPINLLGYNVYRTDRSQQEPGQTPLNKALLSPNETTYADQTFRFGEEYTYIVRAVSLGTGGAQVESLNSNAVSSAPKDIFAPSAPTSITVAAAPGRLSLFWPANPERDVAGYNIYRSTDPKLPKTDWPKLNRTLYERTTYQDEAVETGTRYYYYLTAVDTAGNTSPPSDVVTEVVP